LESKLDVVVTTIRVNGPTMRVRRPEVCGMAILQDGVHGRRPATRAWIASASSEASAISAFLNPIQLVRAESESVPAHANTMAIFFIIEPSVISAWRPTLRLPD
jgi:hypothetical protein